MKRKDLLMALGVATVMALPAAAIADSHQGVPSETRLETHPYQVAAGDEEENKEKKDKSGLTESPAPLAHAGAETHTN